MQEGVLSEEEKVAQIMHNVTTLGFFTLQNVAGFDEDKLYQATKAFFNISAEEKKSVAMRHHNEENHNYYRGLTPFQDNDPAHKEMYEMGMPYELISEEEKENCLSEPTPFPAREDLQWVKKVFEDQYDLMQKTALKLCEYLALGLGKDRFFFHPWFEKDAMST